jgi:hypothetical protein
MTAIMLSETVVLTPPLTPPRQGEGNGTCAHRLDTNEGPSGAFALTDGLFCLSPLRQGEGNLSCDRCTSLHCFREKIRNLARTSLCFIKDDEKQSDDSTSPLPLAGRGRGWGDRTGRDPAFFCDRAASITLAERIFGLTDRRSFQHAPRPSPSKEGERSRAGEGTRI